MEESRRPGGHIDNLRQGHNSDEARLKAPWTTRLRAAANVGEALCCFFSSLRIFMKLGKRT